MQHAYHRAYLFIGLQLLLVSSQPFDLINKEYIDYSWLEIGFKRVEALNAVSWTTVSTSTPLPIDKAVAFISIPDVADIVQSSWYPENYGVQLIPPIVAKVRERPKQNEDGTYSFDFKLVFPNDSYCSKEWFVPQTPPTPVYVDVSWVVCPEGAYNIISNTTNEFFNTNFVIGSGNITRASADPEVSNSNGNAIQLLYPAGCTEPEELCTVNENAGSIQQLQTSVNTVDNGRDLFLSVRAWQVKVRSIWFVLVPHDSSDPSYFVIDTPETVAYVVFPTETSVVCLEGFAFETRTFTNVTHHEIPLDFIHQPYDTPPGVFGMIGSAFSLVDSTTLSVFDRTVNNAVFVTKEDQCVSEQTKHTTPEIVHVLIIGDYSEGIPTLQCGAKINRENTSAPTASPTRECFEVYVTH